MNEKQMEKMIETYNEMQQQRAWRNQEDYDRSFLVYLQKEVQDNWQFMSWLKQTYPEVLDAWIALHKLKGD